MRTIQLMDAEFNMNNKLLGRTMMSHAEKAGTISEAQHGSRHDLYAALVGTGKTLTFDIARQRKIAGAHRGLDAEQCYDKLAHPPMVLCMEKQGAPPEGTRSKVEVL